MVDKPLHLYCTFPSTQEARDVARDVAKRFGIFTSVQGSSVYLVEEHQKSSRYLGFATAWEEGERRRGTWKSEEVARFRREQATSQPSDSKKCPQCGGRGYEFGHYGALTCPMCFW